MNPTIDVADPADDRRWAGAGRPHSLAAVGFSLIFGVMNVVNLSHGVLVLIGAYISYTLWHLFGIDPLLSIPLTWRCCSVSATSISAASSSSRSIARAAASMLVTFGVALVLRNILVLIFSPDFKSLTPAYASRRSARRHHARLRAHRGALRQPGAADGADGGAEPAAMGRTIRATAQQEMAARLAASMRGTSMG